MSIATELREATKQRETLARDWLRDRREVSFLISTL